MFELKIFIQLVCILAALCGMIVTGHEAYILSFGFCLGIFICSLINDLS